MTDHPASDSIVIAFLESLSRTGIKPATVANHLSNLRTFHKRLNRPYKFLYTRRTADFIKGLSKLHRTTVKRLPAVTHQQYISIIQALQGHPEGDMLRLAAALAFCGLLRASNLAPKSLLKFTRLMHLTMDNIKDIATGLLIDIPWTKTNQARDLPLRIFIPQTGGVGCPLLLFRRYRERWAGQDAALPLLKWSKGRPATASELRAALNQVHTAVGMDPRTGLHAYRRGGAQHYFIMGVPFQVIKRLGTWKSDNILRYLQDAVPLGFSMTTPGPSHLVGTAFFQPQVLRAAY